jgi:16S rRNA (cytidine1402-2'-O)-methyltransferase
MKSPGTLIIVATPNGNYQDITLRAIEILKTVDGIICEEYREGSTLLKKIGVQPKEIIILNEHNENEKFPEISIRIVNGQSMALISDCGTPVFADPGAKLIDLASSMDIRISPIPGPSSLMAALSVLDFKLDRFLFLGFLPRDPALRKKELTQNKNLRIPLIVMDTPYRLAAILEDVKNVFGGNHSIILACDLTLPSEKIHRGGVADIQKHVGNSKAEFILIIR